MSASNLNVSLDPSALGLLIAFVDHQPFKSSALRSRLSSLRKENRLPIEAWWSLLDELYLQYPRPGLGLEIGQFFQPYHAGLLGYLAMHSSTMGQALLRIHRFQPLLHNLVPTEFRLESDALVLAWGTERRSTQLSDDVVGSALIRLLRLITGDYSVSPSAIKHPGPAPIHSNMYEEIFKCRVEFNSPANEIHFPLRYLSLPIQTEDPNLIELIETLAGTVMESLPLQDSLVDKVKKAILSVMQNGPPDMSSISKCLGIAERTLHRALQERGVQFTEIVRSLRYQLARSYLADSNISLLELSLVLGYADQSVFTRAFKKWSGQSPLQWRKANRVI